MNTNTNVIWILIIKAPELKVGRFSSGIYYLYPNLAICFTYTRACSLTMNLRCHNYFQEHLVGRLGLSPGRLTTGVAMQLLFERALLGKYARSSMNLVSCYEIHLFWWNSRIIGGWCHFSRHFAYEGPYMALFTHIGPYMADLCTFSHISRQFAILRALFRHLVANLLIWCANHVYWGTICKCRA